MKTLMESKEAFTAYATIEAGIYMLAQIDKRLDSRTPIEIAVDKATGNDKQLEIDAAKEIIPILKDMIAAKKVIGMEYEKDERFLQQCREMTETKTN